MTWRHGSIGICLMVVCASANAAEPDVSCTRHVSYVQYHEPLVIHAYRASVPALSAPDELRVSVGLLYEDESDRSPVSAFATSVFAMMPPSVFDITSSVADVALALDDELGNEFFGAFDVTLTRIDGKLHVRWSAADRPAMHAPRDRLFRLLGDGAGWSIAATVAR